MLLKARRRPSPAMLVALLALFVAMSGSATAAVIVSSSDQLANEVVASSKIGERAVTNSRIGTGAVNSRTLTAAAVRNHNLDNPVYSASVAADGTVTSAVGVTGAAKPIGGLTAGIYRVTFENDVSDCAIVASPVQRDVHASTQNSTAAPNSATVTLTRLKYTPSIGDVMAFGVEGSFSVIAQC